MRVVSTHEETGEGHKGEHSKPHRPSLPLTYRTQQNNRGFFAFAGAFGGKGPRCRRILYQVNKKARSGASKAGAGVRAARGAARGGEGVIYAPLPG